MTSRKNEKRMRKKLGWRVKIYLFSGVITATAVLVGLVAAAAIAYINSSMQEAVRTAKIRAEVASTARVSVIGIERAIARLIAAGTPELIRLESVSAIRAASILDESLQLLERQLPADPAVQQLVKLNSEITAPRMGIIKAARTNENAAAQQLSEQIKEHVRQIEELSDKVLNEQQALLSRQFEVVASISRKSIFFLGIFAVLSILLAIGASRIFSRLLSRSIEDLQRGEESLGRNATEVAEIAKDISLCAGHTGAAVDEIKGGMQDVHVTTEQSSKQISHAITHIEEMLGSVTRNAKNIANIAKPT